jgi:xanthine dehydrogenase YagT iron-sulfur-binding subunit
VLIEGRRINACLTLAVMHDGDSSPPSKALHKARRCIRCSRPSFRTTASSAATARRGRSAPPPACWQEVRAGMPSHVTQDLGANRPLTEAEIRERMSGNICRCSAYPNIVAAIKEAAGGRS